MLFLTELSSCLPNCYYPIFIFVHMKYQVVQSTGGTFVTIFYCRATSYSLSIEHNFVDNQLYQLQMMLILLGTVNVEGKMMAYKLYSISNTKGVVFLIPL